MPIPPDRIPAGTRRHAETVAPAAEALRPSGVAVTPSAAKASAITRATRVASVARPTKATRLGPEPETATAAAPAFWAAAHAARAPGISLSRDA